MNKNTVFTPMKPALIPVPENEAILDLLPEKYVTIMIGRTKKIYKKGLVPLF